MSVNPQATPDSDPRSRAIEADIARLETAIRQLKIQYDMFFNGARTTPPVELRDEVERLIRKHSNSPIPRYANRFHFNTIVSRYNSLSELWGRSLRSMEEGDRAVPAVAGQAHRGEKLLARCKIRDPHNDHEPLRDLYKRYCAAQDRHTGRKPTVTYDRFVRGITAQAQRLRESARCGEIELRVVLENDKIQLKARSGR